MLISKLIIGCLTTGTIFNQSNVNTITKYETTAINNFSDADYLKPQNTNIKLNQQLAVGSAYDDKKNHVKEINICNKFKKNYLCPDEVNWNARAMLSLCEQQTTPTNDSNDYGYFEYSDSAHEDKKDLNERVENWVNPYLDNLSFDYKQFYSEFGITPINLQLPNVELWPKGKELSELSIPGAFKDKNNNKTLFEKINESDGFKENLRNTSNYREGMPFLYIKDEKITNRKHKSKEHLIAYWAEGLGIPNETYKMHNLWTFGDKNPIVATYNLKKLFAIIGANYEQRTIKIGLNQSYLANAKKLNDRHLSTINKLDDQLKIITSKYPNFDKQIFINLINMNILGEDNIQNLILYLERFNVYDFLNIYKFMKKTPSLNETKFANSLGFDKFENPWIVINDLKNKMKLQLNYEVTNPQKDTEWVKQSADLNFIDLDKGVDILLNKDSNGNLPFRFDSIVNDEINTKDTYINSQTIENINNESNHNVINNNEIFYVKTSKITDVKFKETDDSFNNKFMPIDLTDGQILSKYLTIINDCQEIVDWTILNRDQYQITRNNAKGEIKITVKINNQIFSQTYNSFKIDLSKMHDLNATLLSDALLSDDLDKNTITNIFKANGFAPAVADSLEFSVQNIDDHNGSVDVLITKCNDKSSDKTYENQIFTIKNLKPYYIEQNKNIDKLFLHKKPSKILLADFKNYFIVESEAFKNKHQDDLSITLKPNDDEHSLVAEIQYNDNKTNQPIKVTYKYEMNYKTTFWQQKYFLVISIVSIISLLTIGIWFIKRRRKLI